VAHEIAHHALGDLACAQPTLTHEAGDLEWTLQEARAASASALTVYTPPSVLAADAWATRAVLASSTPNATSATNAPNAASGGGPESAYAALLLVFDRLPNAVYARTHQVPGTMSTGAVRTSVVRATAAEWRAARATPSTPPAPKRNGGGASPTTRLGP
jgi:hypothetical protein